MRRLNRGFTLLELLVVISLVGFLVGLGAVSYSKAQKDTRDARRKGDMKAVQSGFEEFYGENTRYPKDETEADTAVIGGLPIDPKNSGDYAYEVKYDGTLGVAYCACSLLESATGNATALPSDTNCNWGEGSYFCVSSLQ